MKPHNKGSSEIKPRHKENLSIIRDTAESSTKRTLTILSIHSESIYMQRTKQLNLYCPQHA